MEIPDLPKRHKVFRARKEVDAEIFRRLGRSRVTLDLRHDLYHTVLQGILKEINSTDFTVEFSYRNYDVYNYGTLTLAMEVIATVYW